jgi:hypothetical protein
LLFAPNRGMVWHWLHHQRNRRRLHTAKRRGETVPGLPAIEEPGA